MRRTRLTGDEASSRALAWLGTEVTRRQQEESGDHEVIVIFIEEEVAALSSAAQGQIDRLMREGRDVNLIATKREIVEPRANAPLSTPVALRFDPPLEPEDHDELVQRVHAMWLDIESRTYGKKGHK